MEKSTRASYFVANDFRKIKQETEDLIVPFCEARLQQILGGIKIPIVINWESFLRSRRPEIAVGALHIWSSYFVCWRIVSVIEEISTKFHGRDTIRGKIKKFIIQNEEKPLAGKDKVCIQDIQVPIGEEDEELEDESTAFEVLLKGNFGLGGALGGFSRKRLLLTLARKFNLLIERYKRIIEKEILPFCNELVRDALEIASPGGEGAEDFKIEMDWSSLDEQEDEKAFSHIAAWGGYYSFEPIWHALQQLAEKKLKVKAVISKVVVSHVSGFS